MADDLEDEWWEASEHEDTGENFNSASDLDANINEGIALTSQTKTVKKDLKRSRTVAAGEDLGSSSDEGGSSQQSENHISEETTQSVKKKKKKKKRKITDILAREELKIVQKTDLIDAVNKYFDGKLSTVEKDELDFTEANIASCSENDHTASSYLRGIMPKWKKMKTAMEDTPGCPLVLIICSSAIRATQFIRDIADFKGENCKVAKLFAKHMKVEEQIKFLKKSVIHIGVGTPNRIHALLETDSLKLSQLKFIVLDWTWRDVKSKRLIEVKDIKTDFMKLMQTHLIPHIKKGQTKFAML